MNEVIVVGGGPAGVSCAIWLRKLDVKVILIEASDRLGGLQTRSPYENLWIPGVQGKTGQQVAESLDRHAHAIGVPVELNSKGDSVETPAAGFFVHAKRKRVEGQFLVIATGSRPISGGFVPSQTVAIGPGTPVEQMDLREKNLAILGGGDNAFDQARFARDRGATVTVFSRSTPRAQKMLQHMVPDIPVIIGPYHADQTLMTVNDQTFDAFAIMYGYEAVVPAGLSVELDHGYISVDRNGETSLRNVFACGEVTDYWHPCVTTSCAHGIQVAKRISERLRAEMSDRQ